MKKIYGIIPACIIAFSMQAQLVLTRAGYDHVIGELELSQSWHITTAVPTTTGQNQVWDFSSITSPGPIDTTEFIAPSAAPGASLFPQANIVGKADAYTYDFYNSASTQLEYLGQYHINSATNYTDTQIQSLWPVSYGYSQSDTYSGPINGGAYGVETGTLTTNSTGTGTLIMPGGQQYTNVLQLNVYNVDVHTNGAVVFTFIGNTNYYYRAGEKSPFLAAGTYTTIDSPTSTQTSNGVYSFTTVPAQTATGLSSNAMDASFMMFPNPAKDKLTVTFKSDEDLSCELQICNTMGALVKRADLGKEALINAKINISDLDVGIYFLKIRQGNKTAVKKFVVEK